MNLSLKDLPHAPVEPDQATFLEIEKPQSIAAVIGGPETGLQWGRSGVEGVVPAFKPPHPDAEPPKPEEAAQLPPWASVTATGCVLPLATVMPHLSPAGRGSLRRWAMLTHVLAGKAVPAAGVKTLREGGEWSLETLRDQVGGGVAPLLARVL